MAIYTFQRVEKKYPMTEDQYHQLLHKIGGKIKADKYGLHTIRNVYFDTDDFELIRTSIEKPRYKEKFRVRGYGNITDSSKVYPEIKKKYKGVVYKRRISLSYAEARAYLDEGIPPKTTDHIFREIDYFMNFYHPTEKLYLAYDRVAYTGTEEPELRITIDRNIRSRYHNLILSDDTDCTYLDKNLYLMEIKVPMAYPLWLSDALCELEIYPNSFSKYGTIYTHSVLAHELDIEMV